MTPTKTSEPKQIPVNQAHRYLNVNAWATFIQSCAEIAQRLKKQDA